MSVLNVAGENETLIGDIKISFGGQSDKWLPCDGSVISRENYPELAKVLNEKFSYQTTADYLNPDFSNSYDINPIGVYRASGITIVVNQPQRYVSTSTSYYYIYRPVSIHVKNDKDKDWTHLSVEGHDNFIANGYCYNSSQRRHYIFGDVKVSDTEYHPAIIHAYYNAVTSAWTFT